MTTTRPRTTVALTGTTFRTSVHLDHSATIALNWAGRWLRSAGGLQVPAGGTVRRALAVYAGHLAGLPEDDQAAEFHAARLCCLATTPDEATRRAAWERLETSPAGAMPASLGDVLRGPCWAERLQEFDAKVHALAGLARKRGGPR